MSEILKRYDEDGYVTIPDVLDAELIQEIREHVLWLEKTNPEVRPELFGTGTLEVDPFWHRLVSDNRLLDIAEKFIGPDIALFASHYICKPPYDGKAVLWHQDGSFWPLEPMEVVTLWLAVDDSLIENGCMRVIPGTQTLDLKPLHENKQIDNVLGSEMEKKYVDEAKVVNIVLNAGSVSIHHPNVIHGSKANHSALRRCGLTIRYIPTTTRIISDEQWPSSFLLRGKGVEGINQYLEKPKYIEGVHIPFRDSSKYL